MASFLYLLLPKLWAFVQLTHQDSPHIFKTESEVLPFQSTGKYAYSTQASYSYSLFTWVKWPTWPIALPRKLVEMKGEGGLVMLEVEKGTDGKYTAKLAVMEGNTWNPPSLTSRVIPLVVAGSVKAGEWEHLAVSICPEEFTLQVTIWNTGPSNSATVPLSASPLPWSPTSSSVTVFSLGVEVHSM